MDGRCREAHKRCDATGAGADEERSDSEQDANGGGGDAPAAEPNSYRVLFVGMEKLLPELHRQISGAANEDEKLDAWIEAFQFPSDGKHRFDGAQLLVDLCPFAMSAEQAALTGTKAEDRVFATVFSRFVLSGAGVSSEGGGCSVYTDEKRSLCLREHQTPAPVDLQHLAITLPSRQDVVREALAHIESCKRKRTGGTPIFWHSESKSTCIGLFVRGHNTLGNTPWRVSASV
jgi:hypothetical protein